MHNIYLISLLCEFQKLPEHQIKPILIYSDRLGSEEMENILTDIYLNNSNILLNNKTILELYYKQCVEWYGYFKNDLYILYNEEVDDYNNRYNYGDNYGDNLSHVGYDDWETNIFSEEDYDRKILDIMNRIKKKVE